MTPDNIDSLERWSGNYAHSGASARQLDGSHRVRTLGVGRDSADKDLQIDLITGPLTLVLLTTIRSLLPHSWLGRCINQPYFKCELQSSVEAGLYIGNTRREKGMDAFSIPHCGELFNLCECKTADSADIIP